MRKIRAFVGHSFTNADTEIVSRFIRMFENLSYVMPEFTWDHAELSRPVSISEKVLGLTDDKNVFIGIYTRKERVLRKALASSWRQRLTPLSDEDFEWKTSDWILQETGLARGREYPSIFFVEDGVRPPSGLHADLEWIPFQRSEPERAYGKFLQMVGSLRDKTEPGVAAEVESALSPPPIQQSDEPSPAKSIVDWPEPQTDWALGALELAYLRATGSPDKQKAVVAAFDGSPHSEDEKTRQAWNAFREWILVSFDKGGDLGRMRRIAEAHPSNSRVRYYYARSLQGFDRFGEAADEFTAAAEATDDPIETVRLLGLAAEALRCGGRLDDSSRLFAKARSLIGNSRAIELSFLRRQRELATESKNSSLLIGTLERWLELEPSDNDERFSLAFAYSEIGERELSLYHYTLIPHGDRKGSTWNNMGVVRDQLGLPGLSVESYKEGIQQGEALSASNLANKYLDAGFRQDAEKILEDADKLPIPHKNVLDSLKRVSDIGDDEGKKEDGIKEQARKSGEFLALFGLASTRMLPKLEATVWKGSAFKIDAMFTELKFTAAGEFEEPTNSLVSMLSPSTGGAKKILIEFSGRIWGSAIIGVVTRSRLGASTLLGGVVSSFDALLYVEESGAILQVLEYGKNHREQYKLNRA